MTHLHTACAAYTARVPHVVLMSHYGAHFEISELAKQFRVIERYIEKELMAHSKLGLVNPSQVPAPSVSRDRDQSESKSSKLERRFYYNFLRVGYLAGTLIGL